MLDALKQDHDTSPEQILHVAQSLFHDVEFAAKVGLPTAYRQARSRRWRLMGRDSQSGSCPSQLCALPHYKPSQIGYDHSKTGRIMSLDLSAYRPPLIPKAYAYLVIM